MTDAVYENEPTPPANKASTVALIAGLLACIPATGLVSVPAGAIGLLRANKIGGLGRAGATLGLTLGLMNLTLYGAMFAGALQTKFAYEKGQPAIQATGKFVMLVGKGEIESAKVFCKDTVTEDQLTELAEKMGEAGSLLQPNPNYGGQVFSSADIEVQALLTFDNGVRVLVTHWDVRGEQPKLFKFELMDAAATQPVGNPLKPAG